LADILGPTSKWYESPVINISNAVTSISNLESQISVLKSGVINVALYGPGTGNIVVLPGVTKMWCRCWGPGGNGALTAINLVTGNTVTFGGGGGAGGYSEAIIPVSAGNLIPYSVGIHGSGNSTYIDFTSYGYSKLLANCGGNGKTGGSGGAGGTASGGILNVSGTPGVSGWVDGNPPVNPNARLGATAPTGGFPFMCLEPYGLGGFGGPASGGAGLSGGDGCLLIYFM
jgi:hypothetical protein